MQQQSLENSVSTYHSYSEDGDSRVHRNVGNQKHNNPEDHKVVPPPLLVNSINPLVLELDI